MTDWSEIGIGQHEAQNPPPLDEADHMTMTWYLRNATQFAKDFGIMSSLVDSLGLTDMAKTIFLMKLNLIHIMFLGLQKKEMEKS